MKIGWQLYTVLRPAATAVNITELSQYYSFAAHHRTFKSRTIEGHIENGCPQLSWSPCQNISSVPTTKSQQQHSDFFGAFDKSYRSLKRLYMNLKRSAEISIRFVNALVAVFTPIVFCLLFVSRIVDKVGKYLSWMLYFPLWSKTSEGCDAWTKTAVADGELHRKTSVCGEPSDVPREGRM
ncbi:uncharacterized protein [Penaeus vannamei]|uniref:uncharacterized protein isoform X2 n=1 Tax=Penaeus vannamei TaxID=6689 RepID=UPI00387F451D